MASLDVSLVILMVVTIILLFTAMVLSSIASAAAVDCNCKVPTAHNYSMYTSIVCGLASGIIAFVLGLYIYREEISNGIIKGLQGSGSGSKFRIE